MTTRLTFPNGEIAEFADNAPLELVEGVKSAYARFGSLRAVDQWRRMESLRSDESFLSLPRIERHKIFSKMAMESPDFWGTMTPDKARVFRDGMVEAEGANDQDAFSYWEAPIHFRDEKQNAADGVIQEFLNSAARSTPSLMAGTAAGILTMADEAKKAAKPMTDWAAGYFNPVKNLKKSYESAAKKAIATRGKQEVGQSGVELLAKQARELAEDASIGSETLAPAPKIDRFGKVHGWDDFTMYVAQGLGQQVPVMATVIGAGLVAGPAGLGLAGAAIETGSILDDMARNGIKGEEATKTAALYGGLAGLLEAAPLASWMKRAPGVSQTFRQALVRRFAEIPIQAIAEGGTEFAQTLVEQTALDIMNAEQGNLEAVSWMTAEGRRSLWDEAQEAAIMGGLIGGGMGFVGGPEMNKAQLEEAQAAREAAANQAPPTEEPPPGQTFRTADLPQNEPDLVPEGDQGPRVPPVIPMAPIDEGPVEVQPEDLVEPERVDPRPGEMQTATEEMYGKEEMEPIKAPVLVETDEGMATFNERQSKPEETNSWFAPIGKDGMGWAVLNDSEGLQSNIGAERAVFVERIDADGTATVRDQEGNIEVVQAFDETGRPNLFAPNSKQGAEYMRQLSAAKSTKGLDIFSEDGGFNAVFNETGLARDDQSEAAAGNNREVEYEIAVKHHEDLKKARQRIKFWPYRKDEKTGKWVVKGEYSGISFNFFQPRSTPREARLGPDFFASELQGQYPDLYQVYERSMAGAGGTKGNESEVVAAVMRGKNEKPKRGDYKSPGLNDQESQYGMFYNGSWNEDQAPDIAATRAEVEATGGLTAAQMEEQAAQESDVEPEPFDIETRGLFDEQEAKTTDQGQQSVKGEELSPLFGGKQEAAEGPKQTNQEKIAELKGWIKELEDVKEPNSGQKAAIADNYRQLRILEKGRKPWEITKEEYLKGVTGVDEVSIAKMGHAESVHKAVQAGEKVPAAVLEDYKNNGWAKTALEKAGVAPVEEKKKSTFDERMAAVSAKMDRQQEAKIREEESAPAIEEKPDVVAAGKMTQEEYDSAVEKLTKADEKAKGTWKSGRVAGTFTTTNKKPKGSEVEQFYRHLIRHPLDSMTTRDKRGAEVGGRRPADLPRGQERKTEAAQKLTKPVKVLRDQILDLMSDGYARTFNDIAVTLWDRHANVAGGTNADEALWQLVEEAQMGFAEIDGAMFFSMSEKDAEKYAESRLSDRETTAEEDIAAIIEESGQMSMFNASPQQIKKNLSVRLKHIRAAFANTKWKFEAGENGTITLQIAGGPKLTLTFVDDLVFERAKEYGGDYKKLAESIGKGYKFTEEEIARVAEKLESGAPLINGSYTFDTINVSHLIMLNRPTAGPDTLFHEAFHFVFKNYLRPSQRKTLLATYGTEEKAAKAYGKRAADQFKALEKMDTVERIFREVWEFARQMLKYASGDVQRTSDLMEAIFSGQIYDQPWLGTAREHSTLSAGGNIRMFADGQLRAIIRETKHAVEFEDGTLIRDELSQTSYMAALKSKMADVDLPKGQTMFELEGGDWDEAPVRITDPEHLYSPETQGPVDGFHSPGVVLNRNLIKEWFREHVIRNLFDKLEPLRYLQEVLTEKGQELHESMDAYLKARNFSGRAGAALNKLESELFQPLIDKLAALEMPLKQFEEIRMAIHALEANPLMFRRHVVVKKAALKQRIAQLEKVGVRKGMNVRVPGKVGVSGKVSSANREAATVTIEWLDRDEGRVRAKEFKLNEVERDSLAEAQEKMKEIDDLVAADKVPHSGYTSADARQILRDAREHGWVTFDGEPMRKTQYGGKAMQVSALFDKVVHWKEGRLVETGLLTQEELDRWKKDYKYYTPMRGKEPDILDWIYGGDRPPIPEIEYHGSMWYRALDTMARAAGHEGEIHKPNVGRGYNPGSRKPSRRRLGRDDRPTHSPTVELFADAMEVAVRGEKNRVAKTVWNLFKSVQHAEDVNGKPLFIFDTPPTKPYFDEKTQTVKQRPDVMALRQPNVYDVWLDGEHHFVRSESRELAGLFSVLNNIGPESAPKVLRGVAGINRYIAKMATSRNPAFAIPNVVRDFLTAGIRLTTTHKELGTQILKKIPASAKILAEYARLDTAGELDKMDQAVRRRIEKWKDSGGETAFWMIPRLAIQAKNMSKELRKAAGEEARVFHYGRKVIRFLEDYNGALEGATRFTAFERALELGSSLDKAALVSREITVDFTRQGEWAGWLGSLYVFSNASLQGSRMVYDTLKTPGGQKWLMGLSSLGFMMGLAGRAMGGEDPEDKTAYWDKITGYEKSRNLIFMIPGTDGKRLKIPLPWGFNVPVMVGQMVSDAMISDKVSSFESAANIMSSAMSAFNPIGDNDLKEASGWWQMLAPSWADPAVDVAFNKTFWGGPIMPGGSSFKKSEQYGIPGKDHMRYFSSVSKTSKEFTKGLYRLTGVDVSPETVDYMVGAIAGGLGDVVNKTINLAPAMAARHSLAAHEIPVLRSFYADESEFYAPQTYRANMGQFWQHYEELKEIKKENPREAAAYQRRWAHVLNLHETVKTTEKQAAELKKAGVDRNDARMQKLFKNFNRLYDRIEANKRRAQRSKPSIMNQ